MAGLIEAVVALVLLAVAFVVARMSGWSRKARIQFIVSEFLIAPIMLLMTLAVGEMAGGDASGAQHVLMAIPLFLLLAGVWRYPRATAILLVVFGLIMLVVWSVAAATADIRRDEIWVFILMVALFCVTPLVAGWLLWQAQASESHGT